MAASVVRAAAAKDRAAAATVRGTLGVADPAALPEEVTGSAARTVELTADALAPFWEVG